MHGPEFSPGRGRRSSDSPGAPSLTLSRTLTLPLTLTPNLYPNPNPNPTLTRTLTRGSLLYLGPRVERRLAPQP